MIPIRAHLLREKGAAFVTGFCLGCLQVALGFVMLRGAGASARSWFLLLLCWLLGALLGVRLQRTASRDNRRAATWASRQEQILLFGAVAVYLAAEMAAAWAPFSSAPLVFSLVGAAVSGAYGGSFLSSRADKGLSIGALFFHENNGFLVGLTFATGVLLIRAPLLVPLVFLSAAASQLAPSIRLRAGWCQGALCGILAASLQLALRGTGAAAWDGLMTASVLAHPDWVSLREVLFFAHPLVIPLTWPFMALTDDPLRAVVLREVVCSGGVVALTYYGVRSALASTSAAVALRTMAGGLSAAAVTLAVGRWQLASAGEEKEVALLFGGAFLVLFLFGFPVEESKENSPAQNRRYLGLGVLLALACAAHLANGLLVLWLVLQSVVGRNRRAALSDAVWIVGMAAVVGGPFFLWLALGPGGAHGLTGAARYFLEYHLSGEFASIPPAGSGALLLRAVDAYRGARVWLLGELPCPWPSTEAFVVTVLTAGLVRRALLVSPRLAARLLLLVLIYSAHFFFFEPWNPESWAPSALAWAMLLMLGLLAPGRGIWLRCGVGVMGLLLLVTLQIRQQTAARQLSVAVQTFLDQESESPAPVSQLIKWLDATLERDAILVVSDRLLASYFHIYTQRRPVVRDYLDQSAADLRERAHLTTLSQRFYLPQWTSASLQAAAEKGRPVYLLSAEPDVQPALALPWNGVRLSRLFAPAPSADSAVTGAADSVVAQAPFSITEDLLADDLQLRSVKVINPSVMKLELQRGERTFRAKWKPMSTLGSEVQEQFDGNNAPRCEVAARLFDQLLFGKQPARSLVPEVVVRAFHRDVPCNRECAHVPRLLSADTPATFPQYNEHLVFGALSHWIDDAAIPKSFEGGLWSAERFAQDATYRQALADLVTFLFLIAHGDANYADNFLIHEGPPFRVYSIDNGRAFDGVPYYTADADPDWAPFARLAPGRMVAKSLSRSTINRLRELSISQLRDALFIVTAIDLTSGRVASLGPVVEPSLRELIGKPLAQVPGLTRHSRQTYSGRLRPGGPVWLLQGLSASGLEALRKRINMLLQQSEAGALPLFD